MKLENEIQSVKDSVKDSVKVFQKNMMKDYQTLLTELVVCINDDEKTDELKLQEINEMLDKRMNSIYANSKSVLIELLQAFAEIGENE